MAKKTKKKYLKKDPLVEAKKEALEKLYNFAQDQLKQYELRLTQAGNAVCDKIKKSYNDKLKMLPADVKNLTITQYMELEEKNVQKNCQSSKEIFRSDYEKSKLLSEKKKTQKKRQRSLSNDCALQNVLSRASRVLSESCLSTPSNRHLQRPSVIVTPKFNPKVPMPKILMRKPRAGEVLMSVSGSPVHNPVEDLPNKPGLAVSLGCGKIINITGDTEVDKMEKEVSGIDPQTKATLEMAKKKLDRLLSLG